MDIGILNTESEFYDGLKKVMDALPGAAPQEDLALLFMAIDRVAHESNTSDTMVVKAVGFWLATRDSDGDDWTPYEEHINGQS